MSNIIGSAIKEARLRAGLTQTQLGQVIGFSKSAISRIEAGGRGVSPPALLKLGRAIGLDWDCLEEALAAQQRGDLLKAAGWGDGSPSPHDEYDFVCPICGGFAASKPATTAEKATEAWLSDEWPWLCEQGHRGTNAQENT